MKSFESLSTQSAVTHAGERVDRAMSPSSPLSILPCATLFAAAHFFFCSLRFLFWFAVQAGDDVLSVSLHVGGVDVGTDASVNPIEALSAFLWTSLVAFWHLPGFFCFLRAFFVAEAEAPCRLDNSASAVALPASAVLCTHDGNEAC